MDWLEITVKTTSAGIEPVAGLLTALGADGLVIDDEADFLGFLAENKKYWDYVDEDLARHMRGLSQIRFYIPQDGGSEAFIGALRTALDGLRADAALDLGSLDITAETVRDEDWETAWKQYYAPMEIGERLLINPCWLPKPENTDRVVVNLDPGVAFGTGSHASTRMCLLALESAVKGGETVLDLGTGSGILSVAALLLGADGALGVDIDDKAADAARENAALNGFAEPVFRALAGNILSEGFPALGRFDLVLANIVADVIIPLAAVVKGFMKEGGLFICSGILNTRLPEVERALTAAGLTVTERREQEDWVQLTARPQKSFILQK